MPRAQELPYDQRPVNQGLRHVPGDDGWPILGRNVDLFRDAHGLFRSYYERFGPVSRLSITGFRTVLLNHPDFAEIAIGDRDRNFSCKMGWKPHMGDFFTGGLVMRDFAEHRMHRRIATESFRREAMVGYASQVAEVTRATVARWASQGEIALYEEIKRLLLDIAFGVFCWLDPSDEGEIPKVNRAFADMMEGSLGYVRLDVPGLSYHRGLKGRDYLKRFFLERVDKKRASDDQDSFAAFCKAKTEDGRYFEHEDIADHMIFLMLAAHDTTASASTMAAYYLAHEQSVQEALAAELAATSRPISYETIFTSMPRMGGVFHETIRLHPPVPFLMRRAVRPCEIGGVTLPADTMVCVPINFLQRHPAFWSEPDRFDPHRFDEDRQEHRRHPCMWMPFGAGAHKCIGLHFARLLFTSLYAELVGNHHVEFARPDYYPAKLQQLPFTRPVDGLPIRLRPRAANAVVRPVPGGDAPRAVPTA